MKKPVAANDIREVYARGGLTMSVALHVSATTPETREMTDLLGFTITEYDESISVTAFVPANVSADKIRNQCIRGAIIAQLPEGQLTENLVTQLMEGMMKERQSLEQGTL